MFPDGFCSDGARLEGTTETIWFDAPRRLSRCRRTMTIRYPDGGIQTWEYVHRKHPPAKDEVAAFLANHGFVAEETFRDRSGNSYTPGSPRAIFWARKKIRGPAD